MAKIETLKWASGSRFSGKQLLAAVDSEITELAPREEVTPELVLQKAKKKSSAMHDLFEWDDEVAAEKFRRTQALELLRSIKIAEPMMGNGDVVKV